MTTPAEQLATLRAMLTDLPHRPDHTSRDEVDSALDSMAEYRAAAKRGDYDGERTQDELAARRSG